MEPYRIFCSVTVRNAEVEGATFRRRPAPRLMQPPVSNPQSFFASDSPWLPNAGRSEGAPGLRYIATISITMAMNVTVARSVIIHISEAPARP
jgi:hypothetical protein